MKKVYIGLDLGIASIGWSLVDEQQNIIASGSHLFHKLSESTPKGEEYGKGICGEKRRNRRILNRRKQRKIDFLNMIDEFCYTNQLKKQNTGKLSSLYKHEYQKIFDFNNEMSASKFLVEQAHKYDIYKIYQKAFFQELDRKELFLFLYFKLSNRGTYNSKYIKVENYGYEESLFKNILKDRYYNERFKYKSNENASESYSFFHNLADIEFILNKQSYLNSEFKNDYLKIFKRHRQFNLGPGTIKSQTSKTPSKWGIKYINGEPEFKNIWDKNISLCPIAKIQWDLKAYRANKFYFIPEISNLISQLVNIKISNSINDKTKLSFSDINKILNYLMLNQEEITINRIAKILGYDKQAFSGYPLSKDLTKDNFEKAKRTLSYFKQSIIQITNKDINLIDLINDLNVIDQLRWTLINGDNTKQIKSFYLPNNDNNKNSNNIDIEECIKISQQLIKDYNLEFINKNYEINFEKLCDFSDISQKDLSDHFNYSLEAYYYHIKRFKNKQLITFNNLFKNQIIMGKKQSYKLNEKSIYLNPDMFCKQEFISPNTMNTLNEAIKVINNIFRKYIFVKSNNYILDAICIETTWTDDKTINETIYSKRERNELNKYQILMEKQKEEANNIAKEYHNFDINYGKNLKKLRLLIEQDYCDAYTGKSIREDFFNNPENYDIDHIIPESISFNSNWDNLVLTSKNENAWKTNNIPFASLSKNDFDLLVNKWKEWYNISDIDKDKKHSNNTKISVASIYSEILERKFNNLTTKEINLDEFIFKNSDLNETTYAISKLKEGLNYFLLGLNDRSDKCGYKYKKDKRYQAIKDCKIRTISGSLSQFIRKLFLDKKNRNDKTHHSVDATICAIYSSLDMVNQYFEKMDDFKKFYFKNKDKNSFETYKQYLIKKLKNNIPTRKNLEYYFLNNNKLRNEIFNAECIYSFKKSQRFNDKFFRIKDPNEQYKYLNKTFKAKQLFENEKYQTYFLNNDGIKNKVYKRNLMNDKDSKNVYQDFKELIQDINKSNHNIINLLKSESKLNNELYANLVKIIKHKLFLTNVNLIVDILKIILKNESLIDINDNIKVSKTIFLNYIEYLKNNLDILKEYEYIYNSKIKLNEYLIKTYLIILDDKNKKFNMIKEYKISDGKEYNPAKDFSNLNNSRYIVDFNLTNKYNNKKCLFGNTTAAIILLKYKEQNKIKINFFKINELCEIVNKPDEFEILKVIDIKRPIYIYDNNKLSNVYSINIDINNNHLELISLIKPNSTYKIRKSYSSMKKCAENSDERKILRFLEIDDL